MRLGDRMLFIKYVYKIWPSGLHDPGISMKDPRWVGAWWLGFIILGTGVLICSIPMFFFPRNFKTSPLLKRESYITIENSNTNSDAKHISTVYSQGVNNVKAFWPTVKRLATNPVLICYTCGTTLNMFALFGYITFLSKYLETEYKKSASVANLFSGRVTTRIIGVAPAACGIFIGGVLIRQFKPGPRALTTLIASVEIFGLIGIISAMFMGCPATLSHGKLTNGHCNIGCECTTRVYQPVCGSDGITNYFSPCYAGCRAPGPGQLESLDNCNCFPSPDSKASLGYCPSQCPTFNSFAGLLSFGNFVGNLAKTAFIPYPLTYGSVTDAACMIWEESCGQRGNCWVYDPRKFRYYLHGLTLILLCLAAIFDLIVILLSDRIKNLYDDQISDDYHCHHNNVSQDNHSGHTEF
ncbi:unnamed protein product [Medioppia subpectinata]|uniref:Kazal-like domain-containing protein n=1 Tax=Medioppia subpectinata TaxID=1979941 RepID=A0A7R9KRE0_9ACAR|nr:unnamed protein product [Medioppia subpectinata]CAG2108395.1 unnamed protein product [Medioppia subpectinata]